MEYFYLCIEMNLIRAIMIGKNNYYSILTVYGAVKLHSLLSFPICIMKIFNFTTSCIFPDDETRNKDFSNVKNYSFMKLDLLALYSFEDRRLVHK